MQIYIYNTHYLILPSFIVLSWNLLRKVEYRWCFMNMMSDEDNPKANNDSPSPKKSKTKKHK